VSSLPGVGIGQKKVEGPQKSDITASIRYLNKKKGGKGMKKRKTEGGGGGVGELRREGKPNQKNAQEGGNKGLGKIESTLPVQRKERRCRR